MYDPNMKLNLVRVARVCAPVDVLMNHIFRLDADMIKAQIQLRSHGERAPSLDVIALVKAVTDAHLNIFLGLRGRQVVQQYTEMLTVPLSSPHWTILGSRRTGADLVKTFIAQIMLMCDSYRRLVFKFGCFPFVMFELCMHSPGGPEWFNVLRELMRKARLCSGCVDLAYSFQLLYLLLPCLKPGHDVDLPRRISSFQSDFVFAMRPTSAAVERNHLVNHVVLMRGLGRGIAANEIESLVGNINVEHTRLRQHVEELVYGSKKDGQHLRTKAAATMRSRVVTSSAPLPVNASRSDPMKKAKRVLESMSVDVRPRKTTAWNEFYKESMITCTYKVTDPEYSAMKRETSKMWRDMSDTSKQVYIRW